MQRRDESGQAWREAVGGFRSSRLLELGAAVLILGALLYLLGEILLVGDPESRGPLLIAAWLVHIAALWTLGAAFCWTAAHPFLGRWGLLPGGILLLQGSYLLVVLFAGLPAPVMPVSLTVGRLVAIGVFAAAERTALGPRAVTVVVGTAGLLLAKVAAGFLGWLPAWGVPVDPAVDAVFIIQLAVGLFYLGQVVRTIEDDWIRANYRPRSDDFSQFNNPEHAWNKSRRSRS